VTNFDIIPTPGLMTDEEHPSRPDGTAAVDLRELVALGYEWVSYQVVNGTAVNPKGIDIQKYGGASGFKSCGVWGVVYDVADFYNFGYRFGEEAIRQGAQHVIVDAEQCAKYTRETRGMLPIIVGLQEAGWLERPVHLCPLGAPVNALPYGPNDDHVDVDSFLMTGGGIIPQAYYNAYANYRPDLCVDYLAACGVPRDRINVCIELAFENSKIDGYTWSTLLDDAGVGRNFSEYMIQHGTDEDWLGLKPHSDPNRRPPTPEPEDEMEPVTDEQARGGGLVILQGSMQNYTDPKPRGRVTLAWRTLHEGNSDTLWQKPITIDIPKGTAVRDVVRMVYDDAGLPQPE
jgi:hypothetical protein